MDDADGQLDELRARWRWVAIAFIVLAAIALMVVILVLWHLDVIKFNGPESDGPR